MTACDLVMMISVSPSYGYVFGLCEHMGCESWTTAHAEGVLLAADETDSKVLHFEGGLPITSLLLTTILR